MTDKESSTSTVYQSLESIRQRKAVLLTDTHKDDQKIEKLWNSLFHKPDMLKKDAPTSRRLSSLFNAGAGAVDAALLVWKLYRKFHK